MPRYDLTIAIFDTIRYIVPSLNVIGHVYVFGVTFSDLNLDKHVASICVCQLQQIRRSVDGKSTKTFITS